MNRDSHGRQNIPRITLGDLTNQLGKRGFSLISSSPPSKSAVEGAKHVNKENGSLLIPVVGQNSQLGVLGDKSFPLLKGGKTYRLLSRCNADSAVDSNLKISGNLLSSPEGSLGLLGSGNSLQGVVEGDCVNSQSASKSSKYDLEIGGGATQDPQQKDESQATQTEPLLDTLGSQTASNDGMYNSGLTGFPADYPQMQSPGSRLTELQRTKPFELERCVLLKGAATTDAVAGADSLESCTCSFCIKAAHIWSELHYMDVKGRLSALMRSKKEASNRVRFYSLETGNGIHSPWDLEIDLMNRSKSLFVCMEEKFGKECSQLETEYSSLKDIGESLKMNLGTTGGMPQDAQHCASVAFPPSRKTT